MTASAPVAHVALAPSAPVEVASAAPQADVGTEDNLPNWSPSGEGEQELLSGEDAVDEDALASGRSAAPAWEPDFVTSQAFTAEVEEDEEDEGSGLAPGAGVSLKGDVQQKWRGLVDIVRGRAAPLAATLEHAVVQRLDREEVCLVFEERYHHFINDALRLVPLREAIRDALGPTTRLVLSTERGAKGQTLAQQRDAALEAKRAELDAFTREHPAVKQAVALFEPRETRYKSRMREE
jgi:hypothetical protein